MSRINRAMLAAALSGGLLGGGLAVPAQAQEQDSEWTALAEGSLGRVDMVVGGQSVRSGPIARCDADEQPRNNAGVAVVSRTTRYGRGETDCGRDQQGTASAEAGGQRFSTEILRQFGGPTIEVRSYAARCRTTGNGSSGYMELSGISGFTVPSDIPVNHTVTIPGKLPADPPMAEIVVNEVIVPDPPDGSMTTNALHITLFPEGGPASGSLVVGSASCDPFGLPRNRPTRVHERPTRGCGRPTHARGRQTRRAIVFAVHAHAFAAYAHALAVDLQSGGHLGLPFEGDTGLAQLLHGGVHGILGHPAVKSRSTRTVKPARAASSAVARTQWSVAMPTTSTVSTPRARSQPARSAPVSVCPSKPE